MIFLECDADETLVRTITGLPRREISHELKGKFGVAARLRGHRDCIGVIDEDPGKNQPAYLRGLTEQQNLSSENLKLLFDTPRNNYVVLLCPRLEEWIIRVTHHARRRMADYNLPDDPERLHQIAKSELNRLEQLVNDLRDHDYIRTLNRLLNS